MVIIGTLTPAYGRDYKSKKELLAAFNANKDFVSNSFQGSSYINKEDLESSEITSVQVRYGKNTKVAVLKYSPKTQTWQ